MPRLIIKQSGATRTVDLGEDAVSIGRTPENTIPLPVEGVSRKHAQIMFIGKGWEVVDLGSRNGTKVNGEKVKRAMLRPGDVVDIGGVTMTYDDGTGAVAATAVEEDGGIEVEELDLGGDAPVATASAARSGGPVPTGECMLRFLGGEQDGKTLPLSAARTTFGRRATNTISFQDNSVSGVHCEITREPNGFVLRDLGSTNGTLVDGEPVVEAVLRHNSRIRVGAQRIVFVDTTVADIESSLAGGDDASEWGLMRGELDVEGGGRRGARGALLASLVVVAAAGAGGWFVWQAKPKRSIVPTVKDNRISDFSFEEGIVRWFAPGERETALARIDGSLDKPRGASGAQCLEVLPQADAGLVEGEPAMVVFRAGSEEAADATVTPDVAYEISARVGGGTGAVVVQWTLSSRPGLIREACSPPVQGDGTWPETKAVVTAPSGVTGARILLAAFDGSSAVFDDVVFRRADGGASAALESGDLKVRIDGAGCLEAVRTGEILLTQGGLAPSVETTPAALLGTVVDSPPIRAGAQITARATLRNGGSFEAEAEEVPGGARLAILPAGGAAGAFTFTLPSGLQRGTVTLVQERIAVVVPESDAFTADGVVKIIVGTSEGPRPFVLSAAPGTPGWNFTSRRTSRGLRVQIAPAAGVEGAAGASAWLSVDLSAENEAAVVLLRKARDHETAGRLGAAVAAFEKVTLEYHYLPDYRRQAEDAGSALLTKGRERLKEARDLAGGARRFRSSSELENVVRECGLLVKDYEGHAIAEEAKTLLEAASTDLAAVREEKVAEAVERLYQRAADYEKNGQVALALLLMDEITRRAPEGNEFRDAVQEEIPRLRAEVEKQQAALYGPRR